MSKSYPKIVGDSHYHLWTDALHARSLAHQAANKWDRGTYVRWTIIAAWTALEIACQEALADPNIGHRFKEKLGDAIRKRGLPPLDWGQGIWQRVTRLQKTRIDSVHRFLAQSDLFPSAAQADEAIAVVREAIRDIYTRAGKTSPVWVQDNDDRGWDSGRGPYPALTTFEAGVDREDPEAIQIVYVVKGEEKTDRVLPPATDFQPHVDNLISRLQEPASSIRVYKGKDLICERQLPMRGT